jgi:uncharacterized membrane protein YcaP (DUF421 family)
MSDWLWQTDWRLLFVPDKSLLEIFVRGTVVYLGAFLLLRVVFKRQVGSVSITDILVVVFIADAAQNAMADDYRSITDGLFLVGVIIFWAFTLDALSHRFRRLERFVKPPALPLVREGELLQRNMRREFITESELMSQLRLQGVDELERVKEAYMEPDGRISVIEMEQQQKKPPEQRRF